MSDHQLDRPIWSCLNGAQSNLARGGVAAVRIDPGFGPFAAARDAGGETQSALHALLQPAETVWLVEIAAWPAPPGTQVVREARLAQLVASEPSAKSAEDLGIVALSEIDAPQMRDLAEATQPGPWSDRTHRYGQFFGIKRDGHLIAMAGERMRPAR